MLASPTDAFQESFGSALGAIGQSAALPIFAALLGTLTAYLASRSSRRAQEALEVVLKKRLSQAAKAYEATNDDRLSRLRVVSTGLEKNLHDLQTLSMDIRRDATLREQELQQTIDTLHELERQERELREKVSDLQKVSPQAAEHFASLVQQTVQQQDKRSGRRDAAFFAGGSALSIITFIAGLLLTR